MRLSMSFEKFVILRLPDGDKWSLQRDTESGRVLVVHESSAASDGNVTSYEVDVFRSKFRGSVQERELIPNPIEVCGRGWMW
jgi:hypothetical protein